jgi:NAD(P)-dependent dehydrogenase (short-subunit alcohol dehydrogenase family)
MIPPSTTKDGYEIEFGTNYLGHALLTQLLMPKLLQTTALPGADVRVVVLASVTHRLFAPKEGILFDDLHTDMAKSGGSTLYGQSMLAKILFAREIAKRYPQITFSSLHPGGVKSSIYDGNKDVNWFFFNIMLKPMLALTGVSPEEGAKTQLWCSFSKEVVSGAYYEPIGKAGKEGCRARDDNLAKKLWEWTDKELLRHGASGWPKV